MNKLQTLKKKWLKDMEGIGSKDLAERREQARKYSIAAAVRTRGERIYKYIDDKPPPEKEKRKFRKVWREKLEEVGNKPYRRGEVSEEDHIWEIHKIANYLSEKFREILKDGRLRFGVSQKALNLYIKYLWCIDEENFKSPPLHCPIDGVVLKKVGILDTWTSSNSEDEYKKWIEGCHKAVESSEFENLAEWELDIWYKWKLEQGK